MKNILILMGFLVISVGYSQKYQANNGAELETKGANVYSVKKFTLSSGGGVTTSGHFRVTSSIGQVDASAGLTSTAFQFKGGFITGHSDIIFKSGFE